MAQSGMIFVPFLLLSIVTHVRGSAIVCSEDANKEYTATHTSASSHDYYYDGQVVLLVDDEARALKCREYCQEICEDQESPYPFTNWTNCTAFTALVNSSGGRCQCWGWNSKPSFEGGYTEDYRSGWCKE